MLHGIDQPGCDIACAFFEVLYHTPTIGSASHQSGPYGRNIDLDKSDAGVGIVVLRARAHDDDGLAGFDNRKTFPDRRYDWPSRDWPSRRGVVREMDRCPRPQLMIVGQCRQGLEREFLRIDEVSVWQPVIGGHDQHLLLPLKQDRALHQAVVWKRKSAERRIDLAHGNRLKLVQQRKFDPLDIDMEFASEMPDKWQGQFIKAATEEADPKSVCLAKGGLPAILQRGAEDQGSGFGAETKLLAEGRQLDTPARSYEELSPDLFLQWIYRFGDGGLDERQSLCRFSEM
jgi:hypothetical protein